MSGDSVRSWSWLSRATTALILWMQLASGACLYQRLRPERDVSRAQAPMPSLAQSLPPADSRGGRSAAGTASVASDSLISSGSVASIDDSGSSPESLDSGAPSTWGVPRDSIASEAQPAALSGDFEALPIAGHPAAWLSLPTGATGRRPVVIVIHGAGDRPERQCRGWRHTTSQYPFIICPRGRAWPRYTHIGGAPLLAYIDEALEALAARYPDYVDADTPLLAGFSLGAAQVTDLATKFPARFPRVALVEGATTAWNSARASAFSQGGGQRVLFGCGQDGVRNKAEQTAKRLANLGLDTHVVFVNVGHKFAPSLQDAVRGELGWLMDGDERWSATPVLATFPFTAHAARR